MDVTTLLDDLRRAGIRADDFEVVDQTTPAREGGLFLARDVDQWLLGCRERGALVVDSAWYDEDTACTEAYGRLTAPLPDPLLLDAASVAEGTERAAATAQAVRDQPGSPAVLPAGCLVDRFGGDHGRSLFVAGTPYAERSLPPELLDGTRVDLGLRTFLVRDDVPVVAGTVAPWFGQPGGAVRFDLAGSDTVWTLLRSGRLAAVHV